MTNNPFGRKRHIPSIRWTDLSKEYAQYGLTIYPRPDGTNPKILPAYSDQGAYFIPGKTGHRVVALPITTRKIVSIVKDTRCPTYTDGSFVFFILRESESRPSTDCREFELMRYAFLAAPLPPACQRERLWWVHNNREMDTLRNRTNEDSLYAYLLKMGIRGQVEEARTLLIQAVI